MWVFVAGLFVGVVLGVMIMTLLAVWRDAEYQKEVAQLKKALHERNSGVSAA